MIVACSILVIMVLAVFLATSPQTSGMLEMYQSGSLSPVTSGTGQPNPVGFAMPW
jgi:hypothetical protein